MKNRKGIMVVMLTVLIILDMICGTSANVYAEEGAVNLKGNFYEFAKNSKYEIDDSQLSGNALDKGYGIFSTFGNVKEMTSKNGIEAFEVLDGNVQIFYELQNDLVGKHASSWYLIDDKSDKVNGLSLKRDILSGTVIVQTSLTGEAWITENVYTDIRDEKSEYNNLIYETKDIQQVNGCYYRIIIAYKLRKDNKDEESSINWFDKDTEYKKCAEVYEFYIINSSENASNAITPSATPRKELGSKINAGEDNGYSGHEAITENDPHYGWDLGQFFINGYTKEIESKDSLPVFLKNVGDRVTLWFYLKEDINCLHGDENLSINEDKNGSDQHFEIPKTNFKRGTLIIRYTDYEGKKHEPVIYTDYLAANTRTGADTKVELFEEGDYEVALDYSILDTKGINSVNDYRIYFEFSIRNGNCMVYPFDIVSGAELSDNALTENGFRLDMAQSKYLVINVKREVINKSKGKENYFVYRTDERYNRPEKDGETFEDEGIYTLTVKNQYSEGDSTTKVIYVGKDPILKALSSGYSLEKVNESIGQGAILTEDGRIKFPESDEPIEVDELTERETELVNEQDISNAEIVTTEQKVEKQEEKSSEATITNATNVDEISTSYIIIVSITIIVVFGIVVFLNKKKSIKGKEE